MKGAIFRGIPYAHHRRRTTLEPPQPMPRWTMPDATRFGPVCLNPRAKAGGTPARARTAFPINIATPSLPPAKRPALMLIYGGAFSAGSGAELFDEAAMVFNPRGILLVSLNYRLGRLGFFSHPACGRSSPACPPATWPMDQVAALRWVKANVGRFGGDPAKVTIMGCSAGGARINALVATHAARGLLARASAHSSGGTNNAIRPPQAQAEREGLVFAARAGVAATDKSAIAALHRVDPTTILAADPGAPISVRWSTARPLRRKARSPLHEERLRASPISPDRSATRRACSGLWALTKMCSNIGSRSTSLRCAGSMIHKPGTLRRNCRARCKRT